MLRTRNSDLIGNVGTFQRKNAEELTEALKKLTLDVETLKNYYQGMGAEANINAFLRGIANFYAVIEKIDKYGTYQENVFKYDSESVRKASKNINSLLNEPLVGKTTFTNIDTTIDINNIKNDENTGGGLNA